MADKNIGDATGGDGRGSGTEEPTMSNYGKCDVPCLVCGRELDLITAIQPYDGVMCSTSGNYGSRVFDPIDGNDRLAFIVCDDCLTERADRFRAVVVERGPKRVTYGPFVVSPVSQEPRSAGDALVSELSRLSVREQQLREALDELLHMLEGSGMHALVRSYRKRLSASSAAPEGGRT